MSTENAQAIEQGRTLDAHARRLAQEEFRLPLVIEAGAGSGKTATLVARVLAWTLGPGWEEACARPSGRPDEEVARQVMRGVLAITFTEAAASEMAERVGEGMRAVAAGQLPTAVLASSLPPLDGPARTRARALVAALDLLEVRTIHACCAQILRQASLDADIHPSFRVDAQGDERRQLVSELVEQRFVEGLGDPPDTELLALAAQGVGPAELLEALMALLDAAVDASALGQDPFSDDRVAPLRAALDEALSDAAQALEPLLGLKRSTNLKKLAEALAELDGGLSTPGGVEGLIRLSQALRADHGSALAALGKGRLGKAEAECLGEGVDLRSVGEPLAALLGFLAGLDVVGARRAVGLLSPLLARAQARLRAAGLLGFQDLLSLTARLLSSQPEVAARLRRSYRQILVDEFQDTDPLQCAIVERLALDGPDDERPGLFIVGDPKQSIYGWRSADLQAYESFVQRVLSMGGRRGSLVVNFRSVPAILTAVDNAVAPVMREERGRQPRFEPLLPSPRLEGEPGYRSPAGRRPVEVWPCWTWLGEGEARQAAPEQRRPQARRVEAQAVAEDIAGLHAEGVAWKEIAILFRSAGELPTLVGALRDAGVPYAVERDRSYFLRREILDAASLVAVVTAPHDAIALVGWLRSAMVGVPDAALLPLWRRGFPAAMADLRGSAQAELLDLDRCVSEAAAEVAAMRPAPPGLDRLGDWALSLQDAIRRVVLLRQSFAGHPADRFVDDLRRLSLIEEVEATRYLGAWRLANLDRFFRGLRDGLAEGKDVHALLRTLREGIAGQRQDEEGRPLEAAQDAVQLMTIHKSKGLGLDHIYLIGLDRQGAPNQVPFTQVQDVDAWTLFGFASPGLYFARSRSRRVEKAETVRLLYVAMTRARQRLVLTGLWPAQPVEKDPDLCANVMELLGSWAELPADLGAVAQALPPEADRVEVGGTTVVFPGRWRDASASRAAAADAEESSDAATPAQVRAHAASLAEAALAARARMRRPWTASPSKEAEAEADPEAWRRGPDVERPREDGEREGELAAIVGTVVHRALELLQVEPTDRAGAWADASRRAWDMQRATLDLAVQARVQPRLMPLLDQVGRGQLLERLWAHRHAVFGRELPILLPASESEGPVGALVGSIDLVLWDAVAGEWVVVDYKTDEVGEATVAERAAHHAPQLASYQRALADAWCLPVLPRAEVWFLRLDRAVVLG